MNMIYIYIIDNICVSMYYYYIWLVVEPTPLKNMKVNWDDYSQYMEK